MVLVRCNNPPKVLMLTQVNHHLVEELTKVILDRVRQTRVQQIREQVKWVMILMENWD